MSIRDTIITTIRVNSGNHHYMPDKLNEAILILESYIPPDIAFQEKLSGDTDNYFVNWCIAYSKSLSDFSRIKSSSDGASVLLPDACLYLLKTLEESLIRYIDNLMKVMFGKE